MIIFAIVIGVLVIVTVSLVLSTKGDKIVLLPEDTPQGIVQRYLMAVQDKDYQQAYNYLSFDTSGEITTYDDWLSSVALPQTSNQTAWEATLGKTTQMVITPPRKLLLISSVRVEFLVAHNSLSR